MYKPRHSYILCHFTHLHLHSWGFEVLQRGWVHIHICTYTYNPAALLFGFRTLYIPMLTGTWPHHPPTLQHTCTVYIAGLEVFGQLQWLHCVVLLYCSMWCVCTAVITYMIYIKLPPTPISQMAYTLFQIHLSHNGVGIIHCMYLNADQAHMYMHIRDKATLPLCICIWFSLLTPMWPGTRQELIVKKRTRYTLRSLYPSKNNALNMHISSTSQVWCD